jgi:hypothetical protein
MTNRTLCRFALSVALFLVPGLATAQQQTVVTPALDFSGVIFGSFGYRTDSAAQASLGGKSPNQFGLDRAYLNFRMPAGDNAAIRITTDVFQNTNAATNGYYGGWVVRVKYGYVQYTALRNQFGAGSSITGRIGILHTVLIDHKESFWPRYLGQVATERNGFFSSADAGAAGLLTLGNKWGEIYGTVVNGNGYQSAERDRFKDVALRASITPFGHDSTMSPIIRSFTITPWFSKDWAGSNFAGAASNPVTEGLQRDRYGLFLGLKDRRITAGLEWAQRADEGETGANTSASPRVVHDSTGRLIDGFIIARPLEWADASKHSNLALIARYDHFTPNNDASGAYNYYVLGASYDVTNRLTFALDWQAQSPTDFPTAIRPTPRASTLFLHWQATF